MNLGEDNAIVAVALGDATDDDLDDVDSESEVGADGVDTPVTDHGVAGDTSASDEGVAADGASPSVTVVDDPSDGVDPGDQD